MEKPFLSQLSGLQYEISQLRHSMLFLTLTSIDVDFRIAIPNAKKNQFLTSEIYLLPSQRLSPQSLHAIQESQRIYGVHKGLSV